MSFAFGVGDIIKAIDLCNKLRRDFAGAPRQLQGVTTEVRSLSIALQDIEAYISADDLSEEDREDLIETARGCQGVLQELSDIVESNRVLDKGVGGTASRVKRVWKRINWNPDDIRDLRARITSNVSLLNAFHNRIARDSTSKLVRHAEDQELQKALEWISSVEYGPQQSDFIARRQPNTGQWLLNSVQFQKWLETPNATMFCPGIPGAGKTILTAVVVDHLTSYSESKPGTGIAYIYLNFRREDDQKLSHIIASLLKQLAKQQPLAAEMVYCLYEKHKQRNTRPLIDELLDVLCSMAQAPLFSRLFIVVDALDECQTLENCRGRLVSELLSLQAATKLNFFATSRYIPEIQNAFKDDAVITLEIRGSDEDVQRFLEGSFDGLPGIVRRNVQLQDEIKTTIAAAVDGMFLLAQIYITLLDDKLTATAVRNALKYIQKQGSQSGKGEDAKLQALSQAYGQAMERIQKQRPGFRELAEKTLMWIVSARRPITTTELSYALAIDEEEVELDTDNIPLLEDVISVCAGLVTVDEESKIARLVHYTTQQYFERNRDHWFPDAEYTMAKACVAYLSSCDVRAWPPTDSLNYIYYGFESLDKPFPLHSYAARHWGHHLASSPAEAQRNSQVIAFLQAEEQTRICSASTTWDYFDYLTGQSETKGLHLAAHFGLSESIKELLSTDKNDPQRSDVEDHGRRTPLFYAVRSGKEDTVLELIRHGANLDVMSNKGETALTMAIENGHEKLVEILIQNGAQCNYPPPACDTVSGDDDRPTPLCFAISKGHIEAVRVLLAHGVDIEVENKKGEMAVFLAASGGFTDILQLLLDHGADVESADRCLTTPLMAACEHGAVEAVKLLLRYEANVNKINIYGCSAMTNAALWWSTELTLALMDAGAKIDVAFFQGNVPDPTPLFIASREGHCHLVRLLLSEGAHVEAYRKFIHRYALEREQRISDLTPLMVAAHEGHSGVIAALLDFDADIEATNAEGQTALILAAKADHFHVVRLLVERGADVNARDRGDRHALSFLIWGCAETFEWLLERGAEPRVTLEKEEDRGWEETYNTALRLRPGKACWD